MSAINGKWKLVSTSNAEDYYTATKASEAYIEKQRQLEAARNTNPDSHWEEFHVDPKEGTIRRAIFIKDEDKAEATYKFGEVNESTTSDGRVMKVFLGLEGDNKVTIHELGPGFEIDGFIEAIGDKLTLSVTSQGANSTQNYTRIP